MATDGTRGRRSWREPEVPVYLVGRHIAARRVGKFLRKGKRDVARSSSATSLRDLPPHLRPVPRDAVRSLHLLDKLKEHLNEAASSQTHQQPDVESLTTTRDAGGRPIGIRPSPPHPILSLIRSMKKLAEPVSGHMLHQNLHDYQPNTIWVREQRDWGLTFYTRIDLWGYFHTYPQVGGPFCSLEGVSNAIDRYLHDRQDPMMCKEQGEFYEVGKASVERGIRDSLYWPDGSKKMYVISEQIDESRCKMLQLVHALLDKYNEDNFLFEDTAFELKDIVRYKLIIYDANCHFYHINFTTKTKGAKTTDNLFFAEVAHREDGNFLVSCTCIVDPFDNGHCYGCGSNMKHPNADAYLGGHTKVFKVCHIGDGCPGPNRVTAKTMDDWKAEEARTRRLFEGLDDPNVVARLMEPPKFKFGAIKATDEEVERFMESIMGPHDPNCDSADIIDASTAERLRATLQ